MRPTVPTILDRLAAAGLDPTIVAELKDRHRKRTPCHCSACQSRPEATVDPEGPAVAPDTVEGRFLFPDREASK